SKSGITLTGQVNGVPDPRGDFTVTIRDQNGVGISGVPIYIYFKFSGPQDATCSDTRLCQQQPDPDLEMFECTSFSAYCRKWTPASGSVTFHLVGQSTNTGNSPGSTTACAWVTCGSYNDLGHFPVAILDQDGSGVGAADLSLFLADYFGGNNYA